MLSSRTDPAESESVGLKKIASIAPGATNLCLSTDTDSVSLGPNTHRSGAEPQRKTAEAIESQTFF
jgi:hypothetical protein